MGQYAGFDGLKDYIFNEAQKILEGQGVRAMCTDDELRPRGIYTLAQKGTRADGGLIILDQCHVEDVINQIVTRSIQYSKRS